MPVFKNEPEQNEPTVIEIHESQLNVSQSTIEEETEKKLLNWKRIWTFSLKNKLWIQSKILE
jgi:hypothetical protein